MSERHLTRLFSAELGTGPASYVESVRIDTARRLLETTDLTVAEVARRVGFRSDAVLHRAFSRTVRTTPGSYRRHFANSPSNPRPTTTGSQ
jgi:transcriptional regulator GlxA family with amidase domain